MIIFEPVIETVDAREFTVWPTVTRPGLGWLALSGELGPADVGTVMAVIAVYTMSAALRLARRMTAPASRPASRASSKRTH